MTRLALIIDKILKELCKVFDKLVMSDEPVGVVVGHDYVAWVAGNIDHLEKLNNISRACGGFINICKTQHQVSDKGQARKLKLHKNKN